MREPWVVKNEKRRTGLKVRIKKSNINTREVYFLLKKNFQASECKRRELGKDLIADLTSSSYTRYIGLASIITFWLFHFPLEKPVNWNKTSHLLPMERIYDYWVNFPTRAVAHHQGEGARSVPSPLWKFRAFRAAVAWKVRGIVVHGVDIDIPQPRGQNILVTRKRRVNPRQVNSKCEKSNTGPGNTKVDGKVHTDW